MKNKRGIFFSLYLILLALLMMGIVIFFYTVQGGNSASSLASPKAILDVELGLEIYEFEEASYLIQALEETKGSVFGTTGFTSEFQNLFTEKILRDSSMKEFILKDLIHNGRNIESDARIKTNEFFKNTLYSLENIRYEGDTMIISREKIGKERLLESEAQNKIVFPTLFSYEFEKEYKVKFSGGEYLLE